MSSGKRRKLNPQEPSRPMSAFALRNALLRKAEDTSTPPQNEDSAPLTPSLGTLPTEEIKLQAQKSKDGGPEPMNIKPGPESLPAEPDLDALSHNFVAPTATSSINLVTPPTEIPGAVDHIPSSSQLMDLPVMSKLSTWQLTDINFSRQHEPGKMKINLKEGERLVIHGNYRITVDDGEVTLQGAVLQPSRHAAYRVCAPNCFSLPVIRCVKNAEVTISSELNSPWVDLAKLSPLFRKLWPEPPIHGTPLHSTVDSFCIMYATADSPAKANIQPLKAPAEWNRTIAHLAATKESNTWCTMITGPKSSGKSTFGKMLVNHMLTAPNGPAKQVAILDLDPGQPEYGAPGHLSLVTVANPLFVPPFLRPHPGDGVNILRSHSLSSTSPMSDTQLYLEMAVDLMNRYQELNQRWPLVINTPGWIQGTGLDLLVAMVNKLSPSDVIYMSQTGPAEVVDALQGACTTNRFMTLPSHTGQPSSRTAKQLRAMHTMAYFHSGPRTSRSDRSTTSWVSKPLSTTLPWKVNYRSKPRGIFGVVCPDFELPLDLVCDAICGRVLSIVAVEDLQGFRQEAKKATASTVAEASNARGPGEMSTTRRKLSTTESKMVTLTPEGIPFIDSSQGITLDPRYCRSLGLVLVRAIDKDNGQLHLSTPVLIPRIWKESGYLQLVLVAGSLDSPVWSYQEDLYYRSQETGGGPDAEDAEDANEADIHLTGRNDGVSSGDEESIPYIEALSGSQKRTPGSKAWRVRRDLGRVGHAAK